MNRRLKCEVKGCKKKTEWCIYVWIVVPKPLVDNYPPIRAIACTEHLTVLKEQLKKRANKLLLRITDMFVRETFVYTTEESELAGPIPFHKFLEC